MPLTDQGPIECDPYPSTCDIATVIEQEINRVELYPNPTTGMVYIINTSKSYTYAISNAAGELLAKGQLMSSIDLSSFMKGMYFIHVRDEKTDKQTILRVVKE